MNVITWLHTKWKRPWVRNFAIFGGLIVPLSMLGTMHIQGSQPYSLLAVLFLIFTLPGQIIAIAFDLIFEGCHRQAMLFLALYIVISILVNMIIFRKIGNWWDTKRMNRKNRLLLL